jgi:hypothetical protein
MSIIVTQTILGRIFYQNLFWIIQLFIIFFNPIFYEYLFKLYNGHSVHPAIYI